MNKRTICAAITRRAGEPENTLQNRALKRPLLLSLSKNKTNAAAACVCREPHSIEEEGESRKLIG